MTLDVALEYLWKPALRAWRRGDPRRVVEALRAGHPIPAACVEDVCALIVDPPKRARGVKSRLKDQQQSIRLYYAMLVTFGDRPLAPGVAVELVARRFNASPSAIRDVLAGRKTFAVDPSPSPVVVTVGNRGKATRIVPRKAEK